MECSTGAASVYLSVSTLTLNVDPTNPTDMEPESPREPHAHTPPRALAQPRFAQTPAPIDLKPQQTCLVVSTKDNWRALQFWQGTGAHPLP